MARRSADPRTTFSRSGTWLWASLQDGPLGTLGRGRLQDRFEVTQHTELAQNHGSGRVAVEHLETAVFELEDIAAGCVHPVSGCREDPLRQRQRPILGAL